MIRVLSIHWGFSLGGVVKYAQLIDKVHLYAPVKITSLCILDEKWWHEDEGLNNIAARRIYIRSRLDLSWIAKVAREIDRIIPDLIMTHGFNGHFVALTNRILSKNRPRLICSYHGSYHAFTPGRKFLERGINTFTEGYIRHAAKACVAVAGFTKEHLVNKGVSPAKVEVIYNGISENQPAAISGKKLRIAWGVTEDEILIGAASRLDPIKGLQYLVKAFVALSEQYSKLKLVIIGSGNMEYQLRKIINDYDLSAKVIFTGFRPDVSTCLHAMDIFVLPSLAEYHSIALLEAMRAGKAIVATEVGGNTESVRHLHEGLIVPPADPAALSRAIGRFIDDKSLAVVLGDAARESFLRNFTDEKMVQHTAQWLLMCGRPSASREVGV